MLAPNKAGMLLTDPEAAAKVGRQAIAPETIWLLNRQAIATRWNCTPVEVENWPMYERDVALQMLAIEAEAERRRPKP